MPVVTIFLRACAVVKANPDSSANASTFSCSISVISKSTFCGFGENVPVPKKYRSPSRPLPAMACTHAFDSIRASGEEAINISITEAMLRLLASNRHPQHRELGIVRLKTQFEGLAYGWFEALREIEHHSIIHSFLQFV